MKRSIALVTHVGSGGVWTVTKFIAQALGEHGGYDYDIIMLATSMRDPASVRLLSPATWRRGTQIIDAQVDGISHRHVGAFLTEFEFQRYRPRPALTALPLRHSLALTALPIVPGLLGASVLSIGTVARIGLNIHQTERLT